MRLLTFTLSFDAVHRLGFLRPDGQVFDLWEHGRELSPALPFDAGSMLSLIEAGPSALGHIACLLSAPSSPLPLERVHLLAPIPRPRKNVFCVGWNYLEHFEEGERVRRQRGQASDLPKHPVFFTKAPTAVTGPNDPIPLDPAVSDKIDWEVELAVVIGRAGKNIREEEALDHVFGYTVLNDVSARDLQRKHVQWFKGKSLDGSCPMGPWIVTKDEVDAESLRVVTRVNGVVKQDSTTKSFYFKIPRLIAELSQGMTLEPGDIISTGTPEGTGFARTPPEYLKPGDVLETEIEGIGTLRNAVQQAG
jgi:2-keto-4-pentenoate hydratase/2-oxohepta-3-ene-1,7-dioic acid hydratase in catechol pathway